MARFGRGPPAAPPSVAVPDGVPVWPEPAAVPGPPVSSLPADGGMTVGPGGDGRVPGRLIAYINGHLSVSIGYKIYRADRLNGRHSSSSGWLPAEW